MGAKLTRQTHKIAIQLHLVAERCTTCSSRSRRPVRKLLDTHSYKGGYGLGQEYVQSFGGKNSLYNGHLESRENWRITVRWNDVVKVGRNWLRNLSESEFWCHCRWSPEFCYHWVIVKTLYQHLTAFIILLYQQSWQSSDAVKNSRFLSVDELTVFCLTERTRQATWEGR